MAKTWGVPGKRQTYLSPGEQIAKLPKVPLNANPLNAWDYKKSKYRRIDLYPKAVSENAQQGGVVPVTSGVVPDVTPTSTSTPTLTPTPTATLGCVEYGTGFNNSVNTVENGGDTVIIGGNFTTYDGASVTRITKLNFDGSINTQFSAGTGTDGAINKVKRYDTNSVLVAGAFSAYQGLSNSYLLFKIDNNGTYISGTDVVNWSSGSIADLETTTDGKIYAIGSFTDYSGVSRNRILRLNSDYSLDTSFEVGTGFDATVNIIQRLSDNKILIGGNFTQYSGANYNRLIKLNDDGSIDTSFNIGTGFSASVLSIYEQSDGKIILGGLFTQYSGVTANRVIRLNSDGSIDTSFNTGAGLNSTPFQFAVQPDGKIIMVGAFTTYDGISANRILRVNSDGSRDNSFINGANSGNITEIEFLPYNRILLAGSITTYDGYAVGRIATINSDGSLIDCVFPTRTPTPTPTRTTTPTRTPTPTLTPTLTSTETPTPTPSTSAVVAANFLLQEDSGELLQEDGGNIVLEQ